MFKIYRKILTIGFALIFQILNAQNSFVSYEDYSNEYNKLKAHKFVNTPVIKDVFDKNYHVFNGEADQTLRAQRTNWDKTIQNRFFTFTSEEISKTVLDESSYELGFINLLKILKMKADLIASPGFYVNNQYVQSGDLYTNLFIGGGGGSHHYTKLQYHTLENLSEWFFENIYPHLVKNTFPKLRLKFIYLLIANSFIEDAFTKFGGHTDSHPLIFRGSRIESSDGYISEKKFNAVCEDLYLDIFSQLNPEEIYEFSEHARNFGTRYEHNSNRYQHCLSFLFQKNPVQIENILEVISQKLGKHAQPQLDDKLDIPALFNRIEYFRNTIFILRSISFDSSNFIDEVMSQEVQLINLLEKNTIERFVLAVNSSSTGEKNGPSYDRPEESEPFMALPLTDYYLSSYYKTYKSNDSVELRREISATRNNWLNTIEKNKLKKVTDRLHDILKMENSFGLKNYLVDVKNLKLLKLPTHAEAMKLSNEAQEHAKLHLASSDFDESDLRILQELALYLAMMGFFK